MRKLEVRPSLENRLISVLQKCKQENNLPVAKLWYAYMCEHQLELHTVLGNYLVLVLAGCASLTDAEHAFGRLPSRNEYSWTSLLSAYVDRGDFRHAFHLYHEMQRDSVQPNSYTFVALLKACIALKDTDAGCGIHDHIIRKGLDKDAILGNSLVDMYSKCGSLVEGREVFEKLHRRDAISWNTMIAGYVEHGFGEEALSCFEQMQLQGIPPAEVTFVCTMKACSCIGSTDRGQLLCTEIVKKGMEKDLLIGNTLVDMYAKCSLLAEAQEVFDHLPGRNIVSWNTLISGYMKHGLGEEALVCLKRLQLDGISPDVTTFTYGLKSCGTIGSVERCEEIHSELVLRGLEQELIVGTTLVDMLAKWGLLIHAHAVLDRLAIPSPVSWAALMSGYADHGFDMEVFSCFKKMYSSGVSPDVVVLMTCLKACSNLGILENGQEIHAEAVKLGVDSNIILGNVLIDMYVKCSALAEGQEVFDKLTKRDIVSWNALIVGFADHGLAEQVLRCSEEMLLEGVLPDDVTFVCTLKSCGNLGAIGRGHLLCAEIIKHGLEGNCFLGSSIIDMHAKCGMLTEAQKVFEQLSARDVVSWNALIAGYTECELGREALDTFKLMVLQHVAPVDVTFTCILKACGMVGALETSQEIHAEVIRRSLEKDHCISSALVSTYAKSGSLVEAQDVFDKLLVRDTASWAALVSGYAQYGLDEEVLKCCEQMQMDGVPADCDTCVRFLKACGATRALDTGHEVHTEVMKLGLETNPFVGNVLVDLYGKCGLLLEGWDVFDKLVVRDVISWTVMIKAYGENYEGTLAVECFQDMQEQGVKPDTTIFTCLLAACSHANLVKQGQEYFKMMRELYQLEPTLEHCTCMIDLLARSGDIYEAEKFAESMQCLSSKEILRALLTACKVYGKVEAGLRCFKQLIQLDKEDATVYLLMADIYANAGRWTEAIRIEEMRQHAEALKKPANASIEVNEKLEKFSVTDNNLRNFLTTFEPLSLRIRNQGYVPNVGAVVRHIFSEVEEALV